MYRTIRLSALALLLAASPLAADGPPPDEPVEIGFTPQFLLDDYLVDNSWALRYKRDSLLRVFHPPRKHEGNPLISGDGGYISVRRDGRSGKVQMWYQTSVVPQDGEERASYAIAYAESPDGLKWARPRLGLHAWQGTKENNIVWTVMHGRASAPFLLDLPEEDRRGHRLVMLYRDRDGLRLVGSGDGIHWDRASDTHILRLHSDTANAIVRDPARKEYVLYCRAKHLYRTFRGDVLDTGESRRIARAASPRLWAPWEVRPQNILLPDNLDQERGFNCFYGMPVHHHGGMFWGFLWPFKMNTDIHTELCWSRDGARFERFPGRPALVARGPEGAWDHGMVFAGCPWLEVGDEWWIYYAGWDGPHESRTRKAGIGLARVRKEGLVSVRGPRGGGVIVTRTLRWPGGDLVVNADASHGELRVRVSDADRKVLPGLDYADCLPFTGDCVAHRVRWKEKSLADFKGKEIRLEIQLRDADLFTFRARRPEDAGKP